MDKMTQNPFWGGLYDGKVKFLKNTTTKLQAVKAADDVKHGDKFVTYDYYYLFEKGEMKNFL